MTTKIECGHCEKMFKPTRAGQKFCSTRCRMKAAHEQRLTGTKKLRKQLNAARALLADIEMFLEPGNRFVSDGGDLHYRIRVLLHGKRAADADRAADD